VKQTPLFLLIVVAALFGGRALLGQGVQIEKATGEQTSPGATPSSPTPTPNPTPPPPTAAEALYDYLQKYHIEVAKDQTASRLVWTDRAFIEITDTPPPEPLATLLAAAPANNAQFSAWVHDNFETKIKSWQPAKKNPHPNKPGTDEIIADVGSVHCFVNPVYISYVLARYPNASVLIKGPTDPALFTVHGQVRAVVSPWTKLPDGTPLL
jgi:hypothetical protein